MVWGFAQGDLMCAFLLLPVVREKVGMRVLATDIRLKNHIYCVNPHPTLSRSIGRGEEQMPSATCDCPGASRPCTTPLLNRSGTWYLQVNMELLLLGTSAAEGWPAPFCGCDACENELLLGGPNVRTRSGALIDGELKIDFGPDTVMQMQRSGRDLRSVKTLIFTHHHSDHFVASELDWATHPFTLTPGAKGSIELWGNANVIAGMKRFYSPDQFEALPYTCREFKPGDHFTTAAGDDVWAMPADHCAGASVLRIRRRGKTIFYGHDSGFYPAATLDQLSDGIALDVALLDCTNGGLDANDQHLCASGVVQMVNELRRRKAIIEQTRVLATHFSHGGKWMHEELVKYFLPHKIGVAYDGLSLSV